MQNDRNAEHGAVLVVDFDQNKEALKKFLEGKSVAQK